LRKLIYYELNLSLIWIALSLAVKLCNVRLIITVTIYFFRTHEGKKEERRWLGRACIFLSDFRME